MKVQLLDLPGQYQALKKEIDSAICEVLASGSYIMGKEVDLFEQNIAEYLKVKNAIGVASGSDALLLSLHALNIGPGDKVIVPTFTFFATAGAVSRLGAEPVFVDILPDDYYLDIDQVEQILNKDKRVKAIIPVHLFGLSCDMTKLMNLAKIYSVKVIEDACQSIGAETNYNGAKVKSGTIGDTGCFSFFPSKNLGCYGDGGLIVTNDNSLAEKIRILRVHGSKPKYYHSMVGYNSRLDTIQAAILNVKLKYLSEWSVKRQAVAKQYNETFVLNKIQNVTLPKIREGHVFHQYVISAENRDSLAEYLKIKGVSTAVYYPLPLHLQECFKELGYSEGDFPVSETASKRVLALPIDPELTEKQITYVVQCIKDFYENRKRGC